MKLIYISIVSMFACSLSLAQVSSPRLYRTQSDIERARTQIAQYPELAASYDAIVKASEISVRNWRKRHPDGATRDANAWIALGAESTRPPIPELLNNATLHALRPNAKLGAVIREQLLFCLGARRERMSWREIGIHESQRMMEFLKAYDFIAGAGIFSDKEHAIIKEEICRSGFFFSAWLLDNPATRVERDEIYCLNISLYPASVLGAIAMYYPDFPESKLWLRMAEEQLIKYLFTDFALDGGYGEGSAHYYQPTMMALLEFMNASKNTGTHDYAKDTAVAAAIKRALRWRADLMAPDGRTTAIGDAHREQIGSGEFELAARLFDEPGIAWFGRRMVNAAAKRAAADYADVTLDPLVADLSRRAGAPSYLFSNYPWSGYVFLRSGWGENDNFFMFKYGPTWIGRRESETHAVIPGHAHEDALEIELHKNGRPVLFDPGHKGVYANYLNYGGYWKATIAHNTVGLGNSHGYDRLDGKYEGHVRKHGEDFRYEREQLVVSQPDYKIHAMGDTGAAGIASVSANTFDQVTHKRSVLWFRESSLTLVFDQLESDAVQPYEWYLNPAGRLLENGDGAIFGDEQVKLAVIPIKLSETTIQIIQKGDSDVPPYYIPLRTDFEGPDRIDGLEARWVKTSLMIESVRAKTAKFLNILIPFEGNTPGETQPFGKRGWQFRTGDDVLLVSADGNDDRTVSVSQGLGFVRTKNKTPMLFGLFDGVSLEMHGKPLLSARLKSTVWSSRYELSLTGLVSLVDKRASIGLPAPPMERGLILKRIDAEKGREVAPVEVDLTFKVTERPKRMLLRQSSTEMPSFDSMFKVPERVSPSTLARFRDSEPAFSYDAATGMVTATVPVGISQLIWE